MDDITGQRIFFHCNACGRRNVGAQLRVIDYRLAPLGFSIGREYYIDCDECGTSMMIVGLKPDQILSRSADQLESHLIPPASTSGTVQSALAVVFCWVPILGFWLAFRSYRRNQSSHGLPKLVSIAALIVSTPFTLGFVLAMPMIGLALVLQLF